MKALLLLAAFAVSHAAPAPQAQEIWSLGFGKAAPIAVAFDAAAGSLLVSLAEGGEARLDRVSLTGKLERQGVATAPGEAGLVRASDGRAYWVAGGALWKAGSAAAAAEVAKLPPEWGAVSGLAVNGRGNVFLVYEKGVLQRLGKQENRVLLRENSRYGGLFLLLDALFLVKGPRIEPLDFEGRGRSGAFASPLSALQGLERSSNGRWISAAGDRVVAFGARGGHQVLLAPGRKAGSFAYVYRMDTKEDFLVLPFPEEHILRAYRMPPPASGKERR